MANENFGDVVTRILAANTAQSVLKHLRELEAVKTRARTRWVWELLQNARDAGAKVVSVKHGGDKVVFRHDGAGFASEEIAHLIYHGSTKTEDAETIGQYGSGFLTTHLLSPEITVSGGLKDGRRFRFQLKRELGSVSELGESMNQSRRDFENSLAASSGSDAPRTEFIYPIDNGDSVDAVKAGIAMLKRCAPYVVVFNDGFSSIEIETPSETTVFKAARRCSLADERGLREVVVAETANGNRIERRYIVAQGERAQVAISLESDGDVTVCAPIREIPKLFLGFPLIGTEDFGFPAVINSLSFTPTEHRDGVYLWVSDSEANIQNQKVIEEACALLADLGGFAASSGWRNIYELATVPRMENRDWVNRERLESAVRRLFVNKIRENELAINESGAKILPSALKLPFADAPEGVLTLWDLLTEWQNYTEVLPRRDEAVGWRNAVESWARDLAVPYREIMSGNRVAEAVQATAIAPSTEFARYRIDRIRLKEGSDAVAWLDRLVVFLRANGLQESVRRCRIIPSQAGFLQTLQSLRRDAGIDEELKDIADLANDWRVRQELRDTRIASLSDENGAGVWDNDDVVRSLIVKLTARAEKNPDEICIEASARLFAWIVAGRRKEWSRLRELPIFSAEYEAANRQTTRAVLKLDNSANQRDLPLAPVKSWPEDLRAYSDLFPGRHTLADFYFEAVSDNETWDALAREGFVRKGVIVSREAHYDRFRADDLPDDDNEHRTSELVPVTNVAFMTEGDIGIMARARQGRDRARLLWRFATEWLVNEDPNGLTTVQAPCDCGETHGYYPAEWIAPLRENRWIPVSGSRSARQADAQSLANLLRGTEWSPDSLDGNPAVAKLLEAMGVKRFDLTRAFMASTEEERDEQDRIFTEILAATSGDLSPVSEFAEDLKRDPDLPAYLAKRREDLRVVRDNQSLGKQVEELVKQSLECEGFSVKGTGVGSDYEIKLARDSRTWLVEVKATRDQRVRMTDTQARTAARERDRFLLCVVQINSEQSKLELEDVRESMRFVPNIGARLDALCDNLDEFVEFREDITAGESDGVQLEVESGAARVRVANSVWRDDGFPLDELRDRLK